MFAVVCRLLIVIRCSLFDVFFPRLSLFVVRFLLFDGLHVCDVLFVVVCCALSVVVCISLLSVGCWLFVCCWLLLFVVRCLSLFVDRLFSFGA